MLAKFHSRGSAYFLLALMAAAMEAIFGWRASVMYEHFLAPYIGYGELVAFRIVVFLGVAVGGYVLATHRQYGVEAVIERMYARGHVKSERDLEVWYIIGAIAVVVIHDWAGVIYTVFGEGVNASPMNAITIAVTVGMCAFCLLPFLLGHMMLALAESINAEQDETYEKEIDKLDKKTRIAAAREIAKQYEDRPVTERLSYGIRGLLPQPNIPAPQPEVRPSPPLARDKTNGQRPLAPQVPSQHHQNGA